MTRPRHGFLVRVELLSGRGEQYQPPPGRVLLVPPDTTFEQLADAINTFLGRWDLGHLSRFELADGTLVADEESRGETVQSDFGGGMPRTARLTERVSNHVRAGDRFTYVFDFGDDWTHLCAHEGAADQDDTAGRPERIRPLWGWGTLPDQYGRRWADDDGEAEPAAAVVSVEDPERLAGGIPGHVPLVDLQSIRVSGHAGSAKDLMVAMTGVRLDPALQQVGTVLLALWRTGSGGTRRQLEPFAATLLTGLRQRVFEGDGILAAELLAALQHRELDGAVLPVDLDELTTDMANRSEEPGAYLNLRSGEVVPAFLTSEAVAGEEYAVDVDTEDWVYLRDDGEFGWSDMAAFVAALPDGAARERLDAAIEGRGAFSRFRTAVGDEGLVDEWHAFSDDRRWGRARSELTALGIRL